MEQQYQPAASASRVITHSAGHGRDDTLATILGRCPENCCSRYYPRAALHHAKTSKTIKQPGKQVVSLFSSCCLSPHESRQKKISMPDTPVTKKQACLTHQFCRVCSRVAEQVSVKCISRLVCMVHQRINLQCTLFISSTHPGRQESAFLFRTSSKRGRLCNSSGCSKPHLLCALAESSPMVGTDDSYRSFSSS